ncbi:MAG: hypothetical protein AAB373_01700 [Patescibacteria group bacterium]
MEKFKYKVGFREHEVDISKEMITYKETNIPSGLITGIAVSIDSRRGSVSGRPIGGLAGQALSKTFIGKLFSGLTGKDLSADDDGLNLPVAAAGQLVIAHQNSPTEKNQALRIQIYTEDQECRRMIKTVKDLFPNKFVGVGDRLTTNKLLGISNKGFYIGIGLMFAIIFGGALFSLLTNTN